MNISFIMSSAMLIRLATEINKELINKFRRVSEDDSDKTHKPLN